MSFFDQTQYASVKSFLPPFNKKDCASRSPESSDSPLGNITKSAATHKLKYEILAVAGQVHGKYHRVYSCQRVPSFDVQHRGGDRGVTKNESGKSSYFGVGSCGDVWCCPICSQKIAEQRRKDIQLAMRQHRKADPARNKCFLLTRTFPHKLKDDLKANLGKIQEASRKMKASRAYKKVMSDMGCIGAIRALEFTHSNKNGWHPHYHEILFVSGDFTKSELADFEARLYEVWSHYCVKSELSKPSKKHGLKLDYRNDGVDAVGAYVSKFGFELAYSHTKQGVDGSRTPFAILRDLYEQQKTGKFDYRDYGLLRAFGEAVKGRAQLYWSQGLKRRYLGEIEPDEVIADKPEKVHYLSLTASEWKALLAMKKRGEFLQFCDDNEDPKLAAAYLKRLVNENNKRISERIRSHRQAIDDYREHTLDHYQNCMIGGYYDS